MFHVCKKWMELQSNADTCYLEICAFEKGSNFIPQDVVFLISLVFLINLGLKLLTALLICMTYPELEEQMLSHRQGSLVTLYILTANCLQQFIVFC